MGGEISPRLIGRTDLPWYKHGVEFSENFLHLPQGPARYRTGTQYVTDAYQNKGIRLIPFNVLSGPDVVLELGPGTARLINENGLIQKSSIGQLILNNDFTAGSANWATGPIGGWEDFEWRGDQTTVDLLIPDYISVWDPSDGGPLHPPHPPTIVHPWVQQTLVDVVPGPYQLEVVFPALDAAEIAAGIHPGTITVSVGTTVGGTEIYTSTGHYNDSISTSVTVPGLTNIPIYIRFTLIGSVYNTEARVQFPRLTGAPSGPAILGGLPWAEADLPEIQFAQDVRYGMVLVHPKWNPQKVIYNGATFTIGSITFTGKPADWTGTNWPSAVDIWHTRLW